MKTNKRLIDIFLSIWQLPQHVTGFILSRGEITARFPYKKAVVYGKERSLCLFNWKWLGGISLGRYIILHETRIDEETVGHEYGHSLQSRLLGPLYLLLIGLPSSLFNLFDRLFHKKWAKSKRIAWYYNLPWEKWADELGGVTRKL